MSLKKPDNAPDDLPIAEEFDKPSITKRRTRRTPIAAWVMLVVVVLIGGAAIAYFAAEMFSQKPRGADSDSEPRSSDATVPPPGGGEPQVRIPPGGITPKIDPEPTPLGKRSPVPENLADAIWLLPNDNDPGVNYGAPDGLYDELARQSFWVTARQEFGLRVGDSSLGEEPPPTAPADRRFRVRGPHALANTTSWSIVVSTDASEHTLWQGTELFQRRWEPFPQRLADFEAQARGKYRACLAAAGFAPRRVVTSDAAVPAEAAKLLEHMRETDQFAAARLLHAEIDSKGESPALLEAIVRAYANLGLLTEFHWSPAQRACWARAMIYAERLAVREPNSPQGVLARLYSKALGGMHGEALADLAEAIRRIPNPSDRPKWLEGVDAYLHFDLARLSEARRKSDTSLVRLLQFLAQDHPETPAATYRAGQEFLKTDPECYRVHDSMGRTGGRAYLQDSTLAGPAAFHKNARERVRAMPGLPVSVAEKFDDPELSEPEMYSALFAAGSAAKDRGTPSWTALGSLLRDIRYAQAWQRLNFMAVIWEVPAEEVCREFAAALVGHPLLPLLQSFEHNQLENPAGVLRQLKAVPVDRLTARSILYYYRRAQVDPKGAQEWYSRIRPNTGPGYESQARFVRLAGAQARGRFALNMTIASPQAPLTVALIVAQADPKNRGMFPEFEERYASHPIVLRALGAYYLEEKRPADAIRCWKRWVEISPDWEAYKNLAAAYLEAGDEKRWREALEESLTKEDTGLNSSAARVALARHYMELGDYRTALPFALQAAEDGPCWALIVAAECYGGLNDWKEAERVYRAAAERYPERAFDWYFACRASGQMDRAAAERAVRNLLSRMPELPVGNAGFPAAQFYLITGDPRRAARILAQLFEADPTDLTGLYAAIAADAIDDGDQRSRVLSRFASLDEKLHPGKFVSGVILVCSSQRGLPTRERVAEMLSAYAPKLRGEAEFVAGMCLKNRGAQTDRLLEHWRNAADSKDARPAVRMHARILIQDTLKKPGRD